MMKVSLGKTGCVVVVGSGWSCLQEPRHFSGSTDPLNDSSAGRACKRLFGSKVLVSRMYLIEVCLCLCIERALDQGLPESSTIFDAGFENTGLEERKWVNGLPQHIPSGVRSAELES
jgi:hypothetical protein